MLIHHTAQDWGYPLSPAVPRAGQMNDMLRAKLFLTKKSMNIMLVGHWTFLSQ
jgi:hypothetical protein